MYSSRRTLLAVEIGTGESLPFLGRPGHSLYLISKAIPHRGHHVLIPRDHGDGRPAHEPHDVPSTCAENRSIAAAVWRAS